MSTSQPTNHKHYKIYHLADYRGQPLTLGSWTGTRRVRSSTYPWKILNHSKTEMMNLGSGEWENGPTYPFRSM